MRPRSPVFPYLLVLILSLAAVPVLGQTQTGAIEGLVKRPDGEPVANVAVTLSGPSVMGTRTQATRASGAFRFRNLLPGEDYVVELTLDEFQGQRHVGLVVKVGQTTTLRVALELAAVEDVLTVTSEAPVVDVTSDVVATHFGTDMLEKVPTPERGWQDTVLQTPGMIDGRNPIYGRLFSSRGGSIAENQSAFDGVVNTSPITNAAGAGIAFESIEEVQVLTGALPAEIGNVSGAFINIVTKSGGNDLRGVAATYYQDQDLQDDNVDAELAAAGVEPTLITDYEDWSFNLGGPISRDRLWFNFALSARDKAQTVTGFPEDEAITDDYALAKLTWQPTSKHSFVVMYNDHDNAANYSISSPPFSDYSPEATWRGDKGHEILKLKWTGIFTDSALLEVDLGINDGESELLAQPGASHAYLDFATSRRTGGPFNEQISKTARDQARAVFSLFRDDLGGAHQFKFGIEYQDSLFDWNVDKDFSPVYVHLLFAGFPALTSFANQDDLDSPVAFEGLHAYAQDTWQVSERVTLNLGLRYNTWRGFYPPQSNRGFSYGPFVNFPAASSPEVEAFDWGTLEPRLAATVTLDEAGRSVLRLGLGRYHHGPNTSLFLLGNPNGLRLSINPWVDLDGDLFSDPDEVFPAVQTTGGTPVDPDLQQPFTDEITLGFERQFGDLSLAVNAFYRESDDLIDDFNISAGPSSYVPVEIPDVGLDGVPGTSDDGTMTVFNQISDFTNQLQITNPAAAEREMKGVELVATKRLSNGWQGLASLVWQESAGALGSDAINAFGFSLGYNDPNVLADSWGPLELDREWQAKVIGTYLAPHGFAFSGYLRYQTGVPLYRLYSVELNQGPQQTFADPRGAHREDDLTQLDLRVDKTFSFGSRPWELGLNLDVFNVFNDNTVTRRQNLSGSYSIHTGLFAPSTGGWGNPREIQGPQTIRLGVRLRF